MSRQDSSASSEVLRVAETEQRPWICPGCGHFVVRNGRDSVPEHACSVVGTVVEFVPYIDSGQAMRLRSGIARPRGQFRIRGADRPPHP